MSNAMLMLQRVVLETTKAHNALHPILFYKIPKRSLKLRSPDFSISTTKRSKKDVCDVLTNDACSRKAVSVGIIGGGWAPVYTAVLLKQMKVVKRINIVDTKDNLSGAVFDASHIDTSAKMKYYRKKHIREALQEVDIVALMDEDDFTMGEASPREQFMATSSYVLEMAEKLVQICPNVIIAIFARPVTATLPLVSEVCKCAKKWDPNKIIGSLAIDSMRMEAMTARILDLNPVCLSVPIAGGADACSVVPLLSQARPINQFTKSQEYDLIRCLRAADCEVASSESKGPKISMGAAASKLIGTLAAGYCGYKNAVASAFVRSNVLPCCRFFATELQFGPAGVQQNFGLPKISPVELYFIEQAIPQINEQANLGINIIHKKNSLK